MARAPSNASSPTSTHAPIARPNSGTFSATLRAFLNTPEPITVPITMAVAIHGPRTRTRLIGCDCISGDDTGSARGVPRERVSPKNGERKCSGLLDLRAENFVVRFPGAQYRQRGQLANLVEAQDAAKAFRLQQGVGVAERDVFGSKEHDGAAVRRFDPFDRG